MATFDYLIVGGGGGGGRASPSGRGGGGGGGGGVLVGSAPAALASYAVTVGAGGASTTSSVPANNGGDSIIAGVATAPGGGGGGGGDGGTGAVGACGGGSGDAGGSTVTIGSRGLTGFAGGGVPGSGGGGGSGAGGGGATGAGANGVTNGVAATVGGAGYTSSMSGASVTYAAGGGGGGYISGAPGAIGPANSGNGGHGGGGNDLGSGAPGGAGGSGVVIIAYDTGRLIATGGTITTNAGKTLHTFTGSGTFQITAVGTVPTVDYFAVGGGGGGGRGSVNAWGAGGGGGGVILFGSLTPTVTSYAVTVGAGGAPAPTGSVTAPKGGDSIIGAIATAAGGGGGGGGDNDSGPGVPGGGAGARSGTVAFGFAGTPSMFAGGRNDGFNGSGASGAGGGGATGAGANGVVLGNADTAGGPGRSITFGGVTATYSGGGIGSSRLNGAPGVSGGANTGNGGGAAGGQNSSDYPGGSGGSGIVVFAYPVGLIQATGGTITTDGISTFHTFLANGTFAITNIGFGSGSTIGISTVAALALTPALASSATLTVGAVASLFAPGPLLAAPTIAFASTAALRTPTAFAAAASVRFAVSASMGGPALLFSVARIQFGASASLPPAFIGRTTITLDGVPIRVHRTSVTIQDILNDAPNTCALTILPESGVAPPRVNQRLRIVVENNDTPGLLFAGSLQAVTTSYTLQPDQLTYPCQAIDDTAQLNAVRPFGAWANVSASTVALELCATFAPTFSTAQIAAGLPLVTITFDGSERFIGCLARLAAMIGGYSKVEDLTVYLFLTDTADPPDPVDVAHPFMASPPIAVTADVSQQRTRVYGRGHGESLIGDYTPGDTVLGVADIAMFNPTGGRAIASTTPDGAASERLTYAGVDRGGAGTLVGPGASPSAAPQATAVPGAGVTIGAHEYAVSFVTALGESALGPRVSVNAGVLAAPTGPTVGVQYGGAGPDSGVHAWAVTLLLGSGETLPSPLATATLPPLPSPNNNVFVQDYETGNGYGGQIAVGDVLVFYYSYSGAATWPVTSNETPLSLPSSAYTVKPSANFPAYAKGFYVTVYYAPDPVVKWVHLWVSRNGGALQLMGAALQNYPASYSAAFLYAETLNGPTSTGYPTPNPSRGAVQLSNIALGPVGTTERRIYRTRAGTSVLELAGQIFDNTTQSWIDNVPDAGLNSAYHPPTVATAVAAQVALASIPLGASTVTARKVYRTAAGQSQLKLLTTVADNTTQTYLDALADAALGANAPVSDTSGLKQPEGQVSPGAQAIVVAGVGAFRALGGWALIAGGQRIRYTGIVGNALQGIPAAGPGAIVATVVYGSTIVAAPLLTGVAGLTKSLLTGAPVYLFVQRDDVNAQADYGVIEHLLVDERRAEVSLGQLCDADLRRFARPLISVQYATRDPKTKSGKTVVVNLASPPIGVTLTIQDVTITELQVAANTLPRYTVTASSVRFSLEDLLRQLASAAEQT